MNIATQLLGGQIFSREKFQFGRFECMCRPAFGSGVVSSFFLFDDKQGFQNDWTEIDFEWLGRNTNSLDTNVIRTYNGYADKNINVRKMTLPKRSSDAYWKVGIEWTPTYVKWILNDIVIRTMPVALNNSMKLMMNCWHGSPSWSGEMNKAILPQKSEYKYVRYSAYVGGRFVFRWQDEMDKLDLGRWQIAEWNIGDTLLVKENVSIVDGALVLTLKI